jgi:hypothetical protein
MTTATQIALVQDDDTEEDIDNSTASTPIGLWATGLLLVRKAQERVRAARSADKKEGADALAEITKAFNAAFDDVPKAGKALVEWRNRVTDLHARRAEKVEEKASKDSGHKALLARLGVAFEELFGYDPTSSQVPVSFGDGDASRPPWTDETISVVNGLARDEIAATNGNPRHSVKVLAAALAGYTSADLGLPNRKAEAVAVEAELADVERMLEDAELDVADDDDDERTLAANDGAEEDTPF